MDGALFGFLVVFIPLHVLLIAIPISRTLQVQISAKSKMFWCGFLLFIPFLGAAVFHHKFKTGLYQGKGVEISEADERARSGTLAPRDQD